MNSVNQDELCHEGPASNSEDQRRAYNRREYERRYFDAPVRFMTGDRVERTGKLVDISIGGVRIESSFIPRTNDTVIVYIDHIGRFEGIVLRRTEKDFAIQMTISPAKRDRLENAIRRFFIDQIPEAKRSDRRNELSDRRQSSRRRMPGNREITAYMDNNVAFRCIVENISRNGIEISTKAHLDLGQRVTVGRFEGDVVRQTKVGYAIVSRK